MATLFDYVRHYHINIQWYQRAIVKESLIRYAFVTLTFGLAFAIPLGMYCLAQSTSTSDDSGEVLQVTTQVSGLITGLIAMHRILQQWMERRKRFGIFWTAASELKKRLYEFEDQWKGKPLDTTFLEGLSVEITQARGIVATERASFFESLDGVPKLNLGGLLKSARTDALASLKPHSTASGLISDRSDAQTKLAAAAAKHKRLHEHLASIEAMKEDMKVRGLESQHAAEIQEATKDLLAAKRALAEAQAEVDALS